MSDKRVFIECERKIEFNINTLYEPIKNYINELNNNFQELYSCLKSNYLNDIISKDIIFEDGCNQLNYYKNYLNKILLFIPNNVYFNIGNVCMKKYRVILYDGIKNVINTIFNKLCDQHYWEVNDICEKFQLIHTRANQTPLTTEEIIEIGKFMNDIKENQLNELNGRVNNMLKLLVNIIQLGHLTDEHIELNSNAINWPKKSHQLLMNIF